MKNNLPIIIVVLFCSLQTANLVISFLNIGRQLTEVLIENEETEKNCKENPEPEEWYAFISQELLPQGFCISIRKDIIRDVVPSKSYLAKPETPPPNLA